MSCDRGRFGSGFNWLLIGKTCCPDLQSFQRSILDGPIVFFLNFFEFGFGRNPIDPELLINIFFCKTILDFGRQMESELNKRSFGDLDYDDQMLEEEEAGDEVMDLDFKPLTNVFYFLTKN